MRTICRRKVVNDVVVSRPVFIRYDWISGGSYRKLRDRTGRRVLGRRIMYLSCRNCICKGFFIIANISWEIYFSYIVRWGVEDWAELVDRLFRGVVSRYIHLYMLGHLAGLLDLLWLCGTRLMLFIAQMSAWTNSG
jgi:hypothetical protein